MKILKYFFGVLILSLFIACSSSDPDPIDPNEDYVPTPKPLAVPPIFKRLLPPPNIPADNPQTVEGVALGRKLFFDPILSGDGTQACGSCHQSFQRWNRRSGGHPKFYAHLQYGLEHHR